MMGRRTFGQAVSALRRERALTQKDLAARISISPQYLNDIEHDRRRPLNDELIAAVADALSADRAYLAYMAGQLPAELRELNLNEEQLRLVLRAFRRAGRDA